jgi:hypothetical protein
MLLIFLGQSGAIGQRRVGYTCIKENVLGRIFFDILDLGIFPLSIKKIQCSRVNLV